MLLASCPWLWAGMSLLPQLHVHNIIYNSTKCKCEYNIGRGYTIIVCMWCVNRACSHLEYSIIPLYCNYIERYKTVPVCPCGGTLAYMEGLYSYKTLSPFKEQVMQFLCMLWSHYMWERVSITADKDIHACWNAAWLQFITLFCYMIEKCPTPLLMSL